MYYFLRLEPLLGFIFMKSKLLSSLASFLLAGTLFTGCTTTNSPSNSSKSAYTQNSNLPEEKREAYLNQLFSTLEKAPILLATGSFKGVSYNPREEQITAYVREMNLSSNDYFRILNIEKQGLKRIIAEQSEASIFPTSAEYFGKKVPYRILIFPKIFESPLITNSQDLRSILQHEKKHGIDFYYGLNIKAPNLRTIPLNNPEILYSLMEVRALHEQIIFSIEDTEQQHMNPKLRIEIVLRFKQHRDFLEARIKDSEPKLSEGLKAQLDELGHVIITKQGRNTFFDFYPKQ